MRCVGFPTGSRRRRFRSCGVRCDNSTHANTTWRRWSREHQKVLRDLRYHVENPGNCTCDPSCLLVLCCAKHRGEGRTSCACSDIFSWKDDLGHHRLLDWIAPVLQWPTPREVSVFRRVRFLLSQHLCTHWPSCRRFCCFFYCPPASCECSLYGFPGWRADLRRHIAECTHTNPTCAELVCSQHPDVDCQCPAIVPDAVVELARGTVTNGPPITMKLFEPFYQTLMSP